MQFFRLNKFKFFKGIYYFSVFFLASGFSYVAFADPPGSAYAPGATLDPSCAPGSTNCTVSSAATASGSDGYLQFSTSGALASDSGLFWDNTNKRLGVGSSTPAAPLTVVGQVLAGYFTGTTTATSTFGGNLAINGTGTSTSNGGFDITAGCYAINGTCIGAGSSTNSAGGTGAVQFANGTAFAADATNFFWNDSLNRLGLGTSTPSYTLDVNGDANIAAGSAYKYNGLNIAMASTTRTNYFFAGAGNLTSTGTGNIAIGYQSLQVNTSGTGNTAMGRISMNSNVTGYNNTAYGSESLQFNSSGIENVAVGRQAMLFNSSGNGNTALGNQTLSRNITGSGNVALGYWALSYSTSTSYNTAAGYQAGYGTLADHRSVVDTYATFIGTNASRDASIASTTALTNITAIGKNATVGASNSMVLGGTGADAVNVGIGTSTPSYTLDVNGDANIAAGSAYKYNGVNIANASTTLFNYFLGNAGNLTMTGGYNTATGYRALYANTTGPYNTATGYGALNVNTTGTDNVAFGAATLSLSTTGSSNSAFGRSALHDNVSGAGSVAVGWNSLYSSTASFNIGLGYGAGYGTLADNRSVVDTYATFIGTNASRDASIASTTVLTNITAIGKNAKVGASNSLVLGGTGADAVNVGIGTTTPSSLLSLVGTSGSANNLLTVASSTGSSLFSILSNGTLSVGSGANANIFVNGGSTTTTAALRNTALGYQSLNYTTTGANDNVALGYQALYGSSTVPMTGHDNFAAGYDAGFENTTGSWNSFIGYAAGAYNTTGNGNSFIGYNAGLSNNTGSHNSFIGYWAGSSNTTGHDNSFIGKFAGYYNTTGYDNLALGDSAFSNNYVGNSNVAVGAKSLYWTTGSNNLGLGARAGYNSTGTGNLFLGYQAASSTTAGDNNIALGYDVQFASTTASNQLNIGSLLYGTGLGTSIMSTTGRIGIGTSTPISTLSVKGMNGDNPFTVASSTGMSLFSVLSNGTLSIGSVADANIFVNGGSTTTTAALRNTALGYQSLNYTTTGANDNVALGYQALYGSSTVPMTGANNFAVGYRAGLSNTTGSRNTFIGNSAGNANTTGYDNTFIGQEAGTVNTVGNRNFFVGYRAGQLNSSGSFNAFIGPQAGQRNSTGSYNTFIGQSAAFYNSSGSGNFFVGNTVAPNNQSGNDNFAVGQNSLYENINGSSNIAIGTSTLYYTTGSNNLGLGARAGYNSTGTGNLFLGYQAASSTTAGDNNIALGYDVQFASTTASNQLNIGSLLYGTGLGTSTISTTGKIGIGTSTPSQTLDVVQAATGTVARFTNINGYCDINPTNTALECTSDATLKKEVATIGGALNAITALRGVNFKWLSEDDSTHTHLGVIAQEVEQILPELVATNAVTGKKSVNYIGFVPVLIEAVKDLANRVANLEARIAQGVSDGISNISDFVVETLTAKKVVTETLEMKDSATGETYCVKIVSGEWDKSKGACVDAPQNTQTASVIESVVSPVENATSTPSQEGSVASSTPEIIVENPPVAHPDATPEESQVEAPAPEAVSVDETPTEAQP